MALSRVPGDDELYVGGIFALRRRGAIESIGITHIVSVLHYDFKDFSEWEKYKHLSIGVDDVDDENLLGEFSKTNRFIGDALREGGKVFVHCAMGKSRSVTVILAYLLSTRPHLSLDSALALVREARPLAEPNDGFMSQLALFVTMKYPVDIDAHPAYQRWLYQREVSLSVATGRAPDTLRFEDEVEAEFGMEKPNLDGNANNDDGRGNEPEREFRCKRCRRTLATSTYLIPHTPRRSVSAATSADAEIDAYAPIASLPASAPAQTECTHHFIHPLSWMRPELEKAELAGRLECPNGKCKSIVGRYAWQGLRCSCGEWVVPGISLQGGRVDVVIKGRTGGGAGGVGGGGGIRMPPGRGARLPLAVGSGGKGKENL